MVVLVLFGGKIIKNAVVVVVVVEVVESWLNVRKTLETFRFEYEIRLTVFSRILKK